MENNNIREEFNLLDKDELIERSVYYKSEYILLSLAYQKLKKDNKALKQKNKLLCNRIDNLRAIADKNYMYFADYEVCE